MHVFKHIISGKNVTKQLEFAGEEKNRSQICALVVKGKDLVDHCLVSGRDFQGAIIILIMFQRTNKYSGFFRFEGHGGGGNAMNQRYLCFSQNRKSELCIKICCHTNEVIL